MKRRRHVLIAVLTGGDMMWSQHEAAVEAARAALFRKGIESTVFRGAWSGIARSRNIMASECLTPMHPELTATVKLRGPFTHMLTWDKDLATHTEAIVALFDAPWNVVGVAYPGRSIDWERVWIAARAGVHPRELGIHASDAIGTILSPENRVEVGGSVFYEASELGTALLLVRTSVLRRMVETMPDLPYVADYGFWHGTTHYQFFCDGVHETDVYGPRWLPTGLTRARRFLTEDYTFCRRVAAVGERMFRLESAHVYHHGGWAFELDAARVRANADEVNRLVDELRAAAAGHDGSGTASSTAAVTNPTPDVGGGSVVGGENGGPPEGER